jgi:hypothetical protein
MWWRREEIPALLGIEPSLASLRVVTAVTGMSGLLRFSSLFIAITARESNNSYSSVWCVINKTAPPIHTQKQLLIITDHAYV